MRKHVASLKSNILRKTAEMAAFAPRSVKRLTVITSDAFMCLLASLLALYLRLGFLPEPTRPLIFSLIFSVALLLSVFWLGRAYRTLFRYVGASTVRLLSQNVLFYGLLYAAVFTYYGIAGVPRTVGILQPALLLLLILASRALLAKLTWGLGASPAGDRRVKALIYGSGSAGRNLFAALRQSQDMEAVGFIDDDISLSGQTLDGLRVFQPAQIGEVIAACKVSEVLLAIPSATRKRRNEIVTDLRRFAVNVRTLPSTLDLVHGRVRVSDLHDVAIEDLLGRTRVSPNAELLRRNIAGEVVLVTGAGGSIGSELCRQIVENAPATLLLLDHSEYALYAIHRELSEQALAEGRTIRIVALLGSVADARMMNKTLATWRPRTIFHAAAYKHVPLVEHNVAEAVRNNVLGTLCVARAALEHRVSNVVLISTDKAVRPSSVMGASKRLAEQVLQALDSVQADTRFSMVRFGNVLGSSGSVVPLFRAQVQAGGPVTVTHKDMTRYFMLIPEAAQLVIQAGAMARGGDVFLLNMGEPVRILDLARSVIALSGLTVRDEDNPDGDIEIREVGLRPGEKLYEELLIDSTSEPSDHPLIMKANEAFAPWNDLEPALARLAALIEADDESAIVAELRRLVPEFAGRRDVRAPALQPRDTAQNSSTERLHDMPEDRPPLPGKRAALAIRGAVGTGGALPLGLRP